MNKVYNNILDIKDNFDVFIFDVQGVLWSGHDFYDNVKETLKELIKDNKIVFILSNSARFYKDLSILHSKVGFLRNINYNNFITSGDFTK